MFSRIQNSQSLGFVFSVVICASVARVAIAQTPNTNFWKGTNSSSWSDPANWSLGHTPLSSEVVGFSNLSTNLTLNNDVSACAPGDLNCDGTADARDYVFWRKNNGSQADYDLWRQHFGESGGGGGVTIRGIANTGGTGGGPANDVTITGNPITIGDVGVRNGSGTPADAFGYAAAQVNATVGVNLILSANQEWKTGGPGSQTPDRHAVIIGASATNTVTMNGFTPKTQTISNKFDYVVVNSSLVDGSAPSTFKISKFAEGTNMNANPRVRIAGNSTYSGGTSILGGRQLVEIGSSSAKSGSVITSGPFGKGAITYASDVVLTTSGGVTTNATNAQDVYFIPFGGDRTIDNDITLDTAIAHATAGDVAISPTMSFASTQDDGSVHRTLTLNGTVTVTGGASLFANNQNVAISSTATGTSYRDGSGDTIFNGEMHLTGTAAAGGPNFTLQLGEGGSGAGTGVSVGKLILNANVLQTGGTYGVSIINGNATAPAVVQFNGQNTWSGKTTLVAAAPSSVTSSSNLGLGSSTILDGGGAIVSGPIGTGTLSLGDATLGTGNASSIEALGGNRTLANPIDLPVNQSNLVVRGSNNLTLTGVISGFGTLTKNGTGTLTLTAANTYVGNTAPTTINGGTLLVNGSLAAATGATIAAAGTLGGSGSVAGPIDNTGTIAPGAGVGSLTFSNTLALNDTSSLSFELGSGGSHDLITGVTDLTVPATGGAVTVNLANAGGMGAGTFTLIDYSGVFNGDFTTLHLGTQPSGFTYSLINNTGNTSVDLQVTAAGGGLGAGTVPEPTTAVLCFVIVGAALGIRRRTR